MYPIFIKTPHEIVFADLAYNDLFIIKINEKFELEKFWKIVSGSPVAGAGGVNNAPVQKNW